MKNLINLSCLCQSTRLIHFSRRASTKFSHRANPKNRQEDVHFERCINHGEGERIRGGGGKKEDGV